MALNKIRGAQMKNLVITNALVATNAAIAESKLDINYAAIYQGALESKVVIDYVQKNSVAVTTSDASKVIAISGGVGATADSSELGVTPDYAVIIRDSVTEEPVIAANSEEIFGVLSFEEVGAAAVAEITEVNVTAFPTADGTVTVNLDGTGHEVELVALTHTTTALTALAIATAIDALSAYSASATDSVVTITAATAGVQTEATFVDTDTTNTTASINVTQDGSDSTLADEFTVTFKTGTLASPVAAIIPASTNIDIQFAQRFNLSSVPEQFAMNEKFVDGMVEVTELLNIRQLAVDIYGAGYSLDNDGVSNGIVSNGGQIDGANAFNIKEHLNRLDAADTVDGSVSAKVKILKDLLATVNASEGSHLIGFSDPNSQFTATTVEAALDEAMDAAQAAQGDATQALSDASDAQGDATQALSDASTADGKAVTAQGNVDNLVTLSGVAKDAVNLGTFTGTTITDSSTNKVALQELETALESISGGSSTTGTSVGHLITLSGVADGADDLGTFTGTTIADSSTVKVALQAVETEAESASSAASSAQDTADSAVSAANAAQDDADNLVTLSGVVVDSINLGAFTGDTITDNVTIKAALQLLETAAELGITNAATADGKAVAVADDVEALVTLSGVAADADDLGTFTGETIADSSTVKAALQAVETALETADGIADTNASYISTNGTKIHTHVEEAYTCDSDDTGETVYTLTNATIKTSDFMAVYLNGLRQVPTSHYTVQDDGTNKTTITFQDTLVEDDNIYLEFSVYNAE